MPEKIKRPLIAHYIDVDRYGFTSDTSITANNWKRVGLNVTDMSVDYGAQTETAQDIISNSATTELTGYQPTSAVSQQCTKGDEIFEFITGLRRNRAILGESNTSMLNVDMWDEHTTTGETPVTYWIAEKQTVSIQVDTYGGAGGETPVQDFTVNFVGDPTKGYAKLGTGGTIEFTTTQPT